jgi:hypothetical protein
VIKSSLIGDTVKLSLIKSSHTFDGGVTFSVFTGSESVVNTGTLIDSGSGHWYKYYTLPTTPGMYSVEVTAVMSTMPFKRRAIIKAVQEEVD